MIVRSGKREGSLVKEVLQRSLRKSLNAASPSPASPSPAVLSSATADGATARRPLRSILHNSGSADVIMTSGTVESEYTRETDGSGKKKLTR